MSVLDGYNKYKRYIKTNDGYKLCSQWTSSNTVQMDDGNTLQTNLGAINGITDSLTATSSNIAASAAAVKTLNDNLTNKLGTSKDWYYATNVAVATGSCSACVVNNIAYVTMEITPTQITHGTNLVSNLPCPHKQYYTTLPGVDGSNYPVIIGTDGRIWVYYPTTTTLERIDYTFSYPL